MAQQVFVCPEVKETDAKSTDEAFAQASAHLKVPKPKDGKQRPKQKQVTVPRGGARGRSRFW